MSTEDQPPMLSPREIHGASEQAREDGDTTKALSLIGQAIKAYEAEGDKLGLAEAYASQSITFRRRYKETQDRSFLEKAKASSMTGVTIARESGENMALGIPLFQLATAQEELGELPDAVATYQESVTNLTNNPPEFHTSPATLANVKVHMTTCEYKAGDKSALPRAEAALEELRDAEHPDAYAKDVWMSGGYMRIANMLRTDNPTKAQEALEDAKVIIDGNPELTLRRQDWEELAATFESES